MQNDTHMMRKKSLCSLAPDGSKEVSNFSLLTNTIFLLWQRPPNFGRKFYLPFYRIVCLEVNYVSKILTEMTSRQLLLYNTAQPTLHCAWKAMLVKQIFDAYEYERRFLHCCFLNPGWISLLFFFHSFYFLRYHRKFGISWHDKFPIRNYSLTKKKNGKPESFQALKFTPGL